MENKAKKSYIKAIETVYKGHRFRSRTEARWAVFFDTLGWQWHYETEGYALGLSKTWYLPDFYMPTWDKYVEVKPLNQPTVEEMKKAALLIQHTGKAMLMLIGQPWPGDYATLLIASANDPAKVAPFSAAIIPYEMTGQLGYAPHSGRAYLHYKDDTLPLPLLCLELDLVVDSNRLIMIMNPDKVSYFAEDMDTGIHIIDGSMNSVKEVLEMDTNLSRAYIAARQARFEQGENR
jgi:hypothetical protein